ncbi:hypothetical protein Emag_002016 [Eimeria magna]
MEVQSLSVDSSVSDEKNEKTSADENIPVFPEVLRCTRGGRVVAHSSLDEIYGEARDAQERQDLLRRLQGMSLQQKLSCCIQLKSKGNAYYTAAEYLPATACYEQGLMALDFGSSREEEEYTRKQLLLPLLLNLSACLLKLRRFDKASAVCDVALREEPHCLKALYRRAIARKELGDLNAAKADFQRILDLCEATSENHQMQQQQQRQLEQQMQQQEKDEQPKSEKAQPAQFYNRKDSREEAGVAAEPAGAPSRDSCESRGPSASSSDFNGLLVLLCRRELININQQQRRYSAACSRMFGGVKGRRQQQASATALTKHDKREKKTLRVVHWTTSHSCWIRECACKVVQWTTGLSWISLRLCKKRGR